MTTEPTMFKTFANRSELFKKTTGYKIYARLTNKWFVPVTKKALRMVAKSMEKNKEAFCGDIHFAGGGNKSVQVTFK
jgi:hypothetical protein